VTDEVERLAATLRRESTAGITAAELATTLSVLQRVRGNLIELDREDRGEPPSKG
jgi:MarR family transcriptional regulator for hemolysin